MASESESVHRFRHGNSRRLYCDVSVSGHRHGFGFVAYFYSLRTALLPFLFDEDAEKLRATNLSFLDSDRVINLNDPAPVLPAG